MGDDLARTLALQSALLEMVGTWGYERVETPLIEEADLFLRKSGGELAARLYGVTDPGGRRVALRPEYTASVIRAFVGMGQRPPLPLRWCYAGPVLRHQPLEQGERRQITQVGAEMVGAAGAAADAEVVAIAVHGLKRTGLRKPVVTIGHLGVLGDLLLAFGLSDRAELFLLARLGTLQDPSHGADAVLAEARLLRLMPDGAGSNGALARVLGVMDPEEARAAVHQFVAALGPAWVGSRDMREVEERLLDKLGQTEDPEKMRRAVRFLSDLTRIRGDGASVVREAEAVAGRYGLDDAAVAPLRELVRLLDRLDELADVRVVWDLGFARGLAYYTGVVFELTHADLTGRVLGGGGRYDGLVRALGGPDLPALGFAYSLEVVDEARVLEGLPPLVGPARPAKALVVPERPDDAAAAFREAARRRGERPGAVAVAVYPHADLERARAYARAWGADQLVAVGPQGPRVESIAGATT